jgi:hypothetical protein
MQVTERGAASTVRLSRRFIPRRGVITVLFTVVLAATTAMAQHNVGTVTETITTRRDVNGRDAVSEKVVTHRDRTNDEERVVIETYLPSIEGGRLALSRRVNRMTTVTDDRSQTVEETAERNPVALSDPMRIVRRSVTTVRTRGTGSFVTERQVFERDVNGRLVPIVGQTESSSRN